MRPPDAARLGVSVVGLSKSYGPQRVLHDVSIDVREGEFVVLLGASGSGKTTLLMSVAGFAQPDEGRIVIGGRDVTFLPPSRREIGVVFQSYALFPHMSVFENLAYPLRLRRRARSAVRERVRDIAAIVKLEDFLERGVNRLSGGQRQRVALARALVFEPNVLLMDEPMSALDRNLRRELQAELRRIQHRLGTTTLFVTHDQEEAAYLADRVAILRDGRLLQFDTPETIYRRPADNYVASFFGDVAELSPAAVSNENGAAPLHGPIAFRPEMVSLAPGPATPAYRCEGVVVERLFLRDYVELAVRVATGEVVKIRVSGPAATGAADVGERCHFRVRPEDLIPTS